MRISDRWQTHFAFRLSPALIRRSSWFRIEWIRTTRISAQRSDWHFDVSLYRSFQVGEQRRLEFRWESFNAFNHPQFTQIPAKSVGIDTPPSHFLNRDFTDSGIRTMWVQIKLLF